MAGAFTHFIICDVAKRKRTALGSDLYRLLNRNSQFLFLGAASPDLPYLSMKTGSVNWADVMHYEKTAGIATSGYAELKKTWPSRTAAEEVQLAWLFGYVSHLVADATIHPIVQATVGPYAQNKTDHLLCEMTEDSLVFMSRKNADVTYAEFSEILKFCSESPHFNSLMEFWKRQLLQNYAEKAEEPRPSLWFTTYTEAVDLAEGGSTVGIFRHMGGENFVYKSESEIRNSFSEHYEKYFRTVKLPNGNSSTFMSNGFDKAVTNVATAWSKLFTGFGSTTVAMSDVIKNWNLDTGENMDSLRKEVTFWA